MRNVTIIAFISLFLFSCTKKENTIDLLDYSFSGTFSQVYSLKINQTDTVYIHQEWMGYRLKNGISDPKDKTNYYAILNKKEKEKVAKTIILEGNLNPNIVGQSAFKVTVSIISNILSIHSLTCG